jgi:hypothetical protein
MLMSLPLFPQEAKQEPKPQEPQAQAVIMLRYADPEEIRRLLAPFAVSATANRELKAIAVNGSRAAVAAYEEAVKRLDVPSPPQKNIELTAYILEAGRQPGAGRSVPPGLEGVVKQLEAVFQFQSMRVLDTAVLRGRVGQQVAASGFASFGAELGPALYQINLWPWADEKSQTVRVNQLRLRMQIPKTDKQATLEANVDVKEGQHVVVGKTGLDGPDRALIIVLSARIVE